MAYHYTPDDLPHSDEWDDCDYCLKPISASRPPTLIADNCSCAERAAFASGRGDEDHPVYGVSMPYDHVNIIPTFQTAALNFVVGHVPPSYDSTTLDEGLGQHGIEQHAPELIMTSLEQPDLPKQSAVHSNMFLPLSATTTDNERRARKSYFSHAKHSYTLETYLNTNEEPFIPAYDGDGERPPEQYNNVLRSGCFLDQGMQFGNDSMLVAPQTSRRSKLSYKSSGEHSSMERSWHFFHNQDPMSHAGGWAEADGDFYMNEDDFLLNESEMAEYDD